MLIDRIDQDYKTAMRSQDATSLAVLRQLKTAITVAETSQKVRRSLSDEEIIDVIQRQIKQRRESEELYRAANRNVLADVEAQEREFLEHYLPQQLTEKEIISLVQNTIESIPENALNKGAVMKILMPQVRGRVDGKLVNEIVINQLLLRGVDAN